MFTGIIERTGTVKSIRTSGTARQLVIETSYDELESGESVTVNGTCLTVVEFSGRTGETEFFVSGETLARTNLGQLAAGSTVNLERALRADARLSGHFVQGHVDGIAKISAIREQPGGGFEASFELSDDIIKYCVEKGSIALDGVSLTINKLTDHGIDIFLIPHTWTHTRFKSLQVGDPVNVELDILAKYVERLCQTYRKQ